MEPTGTSTSEEAITAALLDCVRATLACMETQAAGGVPVWYVRRADFEGTSGSASLVDEPQHQYIMLANRCLFSGLPEITEKAESCVRCLWEAGILSSRLFYPPSPDGEVGSEPFDQVKTQLISRLSYLIAEIPQKLGTYRPTDEQVIERYHSYREGWTADSVHTQVTIPLVNFSYDDDTQAPLGRKLSLAPFGPDEKSDISRVFLMPLAANQTEFSRVSTSHFKLTGMRVETPEERLRNTHPMEFDAEAGDIVLALRLLKSGDVGAPLIVERIGGVPPWGGTLMTRGRLDSLARGGVVPYVLAESELPDVRAMIEALQRLAAAGLKDRGGLEMALRRFNQSYSRDIREDRLVDLTVALESCLLAKTKSATELSYRFSLRGAALVAEKREPKATRVLLTAMYNARSTVVHGEEIEEIKKSDLAQMTPDEFVPACEDVARDILREYVVRIADGRYSAPHPDWTAVQAINRDIEDHIADGLKPSSAPPTASQEKSAD